MNRRHPLVLGFVAAVVALVVAMAAAATVVALTRDDDPTPKAEADLHFTPLDQDPKGLIAGDKTGTPVPTAKFPKLGGGLGALTDYAGTPVVVNFFGSWCVPCRKEMPDLQQVHEALGDKVAFLGLAVNDSERDAAAFVEKYGATYDMGRDPSGKLSSELGVINMPSTFLVSAKGDVVAARAGAVTAGELRKLIADNFGVS